MKKASRNALALAVATAAYFSLTSASRGQVTGSWNVNSGGTWSVSSNWLGGVVPGSNAGDTADLTFPITSSSTVKLTSAQTLGTLNIGSSANSTSVYTVSGSTLNMNNSGGGAQINELNTTGGDIIQSAIALGDNLTITSASAATFDLHQAAVTGTGNLTVDPNSNGQISIGLVNNAGTLTDAGTGTGEFRLNNGLGSNVTAVSSTGASELYFTTSVAVNSAGLTVTSSGTGGIGSDGIAITGTGNLTVDANSSASITMGSPNISGSLNIAGSGTGSVQFNPVGSNVTEVDSTSSKSVTFFRNGNFTVNSGGTSIVDSGGAQIELLQSVTGTGNLILENDSSVNSAVLLAEENLNNTGQVINSGTGTGESEIHDNEIIGANVTGITQNSSTSALLVRGSDSGYIGVTTIKAGTIQLGANNGGLSTSSKFIVGDTAADGPGSILNVNYDSNSLTLGTGQTMMGFGTVSGKVVALGAGATLTPGNGTSVGTLTFTNSSLSITSGNLDYFLNSPATSAEVSVAHLTANTNETLNVDPGLNFGDGTFTLLHSSNAITDDTSNFTGWTVAGLPAGYSGAFEYNGGKTAIELVVTGAALPEPGSLSLLGIGSLMLMRRRRDRSHHVR